jgi:2-polyprenyl-3-methyl-5-hydroxy-6-metoxy-1,4-benzoquinol methylase
MIIDCNGHLINFKVVSEEKACWIRRSLSSEEKIFFRFWGERKYGNAHFVAIKPRCDADLVTRDAFWRLRQILGKMLGGVTAQDVIKIAVAICCHSLGPLTSRHEFFVELFRRTNDEFVAMERYYSTGRKIRDNISAYPLNSASYSHIAMFTWIYLMECRYLRELACKTSGECSILDLGTSYGHFILTAKRTMRSADQKMEYIGVDKCVEASEIAKAYADATSMDNVRFSVLDIAKKGFLDAIMRMNGGQRFEGVVANHIMEHLAAPTFRTLMQWCSLSNNIVMVSVPLYDKPAISVCDGHVHYFDVKRLEKLGARIEKATKEYWRYCRQKMLLRSGLLILATSSFAAKLQRSLWQPADQLSS